MPASFAIAPNAPGACAGRPGVVQRDVFPSLHPAFRVPRRFAVLITRFRSCDSIAVCAGDECPEKPAMCARWGGVLPHEPDLQRPRNHPHSRDVHHFTKKFAGFYRALLQARAWSLALPGSATRTCCGRKLARTSAPVAASGAPGASGAAYNLPAPAIEVQRRRFRHVTVAGNTFIVPTKFLTKGLTGRS